MAHRCEQLAQSRHAAGNRARDFSIASPTLDSCATRRSLRPVVSSTQSHLTVVQPVVPTGKMFLSHTRSSRLSNPSYDRSDNRVCPRCIVYRVNKRSSCCNRFNNRLNECIHDTTGSIRSTYQPWTLFVDDTADIPRRRRAFYAVKQVRASPFPTVVRPHRMHRTDAVYVHYGPWALPCGILPSYFGHL